MAGLHSLTLGAVLAVVLLGAPAHAQSAASPSPQSARPAPLSRTAAFNGVWTTVEAPRELRTSDGAPPPFLDPKLADYASRPPAIEDSLKRCLPAGVPRIYLQPDNAFRLVIGETKAALTFEQNHLFRLIYIDAEHFEATGPSYLGQSIATWDGDTLVVDTNNFNDATFLDNAGLPHSDQLHLIERFSVGTDGRLQVRIRIEDPKTFARPWETVLHFVRRPTPLIREDYCLRRSGLLSAPK